MENNDFRTYSRRGVTRRSGNKASGIRTGGECLIYTSHKMKLTKETSFLYFKKDKIDLEPLFELSTALIAFSGYIKSSNKINLSLELNYTLEDGTPIYKSKKYHNILNTDTWNGIGIHIPQKIDDSINQFINDVSIKLDITGPIDTEINFISFDLDSVKYQDYLSHDFYKPFKQKTNMHIPHIYYLDTDIPFQECLTSYDGIENTISSGEPVILKSCNRCTRFLPINIFSELNTLAFSLHCKKKAPCNHSIFSSYSILNTEALQNIPQSLSSYIRDGEIISHHGHQLECKACKKFYVNYALNPLRNPQQFKEDGLRRRALEVLVNTLLERNLVHFEFERKNKKEFTTYIWEKFDKKCFKCSKPLKINEMHLDHTMPLAYLYRLDETATCLCPEHNSQKTDSFPVDFYSSEELNDLYRITNIDYEVLTSRSPNMKVISLLIENVTWFFDEFLMKEDYQKVRDNILTADKIYASLVRILISTNINLVDSYYNFNKKYPTSITIKN